MEVLSTGVREDDEERDQLEKSERSRRALLSVLEDMREAEAALRRRADEFAALYETARDLADQQDLLSLFENIVLHATVLLDAPVGAVWLFDAVRGDLELVSVVGQSAPLGTRLRLGEGMAGRVAQSRQALIVNDYNTWEHRSPAFESIAIRAMVQVPMLSHGELIGVLSVNELAPSTLEFREADAKLLSLFATLAAGAVHNARLLEQACTRADELAASERKLQQACDSLRQAQEQVVQQERLRALGQMASGIAHDFNNALCPILGYSELLVLDGNLPPDVQERLQWIHMAAKDAAAVVERLKQFYQPQTLDMTDSVDLAGLARQIPELTRPKWRDEAQRSGRVIHVQLDLRPAPPVRGSTTQLRELLVNLVINAVDAMPSGGQITLRVNAANSFVVLEVADTGTGMTEEVRRRCFEPFFTTKTASGTGLGLSVCYGIIERHKATVEIDTEPGQGTTFRILFPVDTKRGPAPSCVFQCREDFERVAGSHRRVLLIDDDARTRAAVVKLLQFMGLQVDSAVSGTDGLVKLRLGAQHGAYDAVITDLGMPGVSGHEVTQIVKTMWPHVPVIMLTGWSESAVAETDSHGTKPDFILGKPPSLAALSDVFAKIRTQRAGPSA